jgi:hypothetical protein
MAHGLQAAREGGANQATVAGDENGRIKVHDARLKLMAS